LVRRTEEFGDPAVSRSISDAVVDVAGCYLQEQIEIGPDSARIMARKLFELMDCAREAEQARQISSATDNKA
jgi:hypothetical protein